jgi:hypothetical protein
MLNEQRALVVAKRMLAFASFMAYCEHRRREGWLVGVAPEVFTGALLQPPV